MNSFSSSRHSLFAGFPGVLVLFTALCLSGCASTPFETSNIAPPRAVEIESIQADHPVVAVVLGAGGTRGFAHIGVLKALEAEGIQPDVLVGSSVGSLVAALFAGGYSASKLEQMAIHLDGSDLFDIRLFGPGWVEGRALQDYVNKALDNRSIEALGRTFAAVATERASNRMIVFNRGNTGLAVRASSSLPTVFWPVWIEGTEYVDGWLSGRLPVRVARQMGADVVIAVDVSRGDTSELDAADVQIRPDTPRTPLFDFSAVRQMIATGESAARNAMPAIRERIARAERDAQSYRISGRMPDATMDRMSDSSLPSMN